MSDKTEQYINAIRYNLAAAERLETELQSTRTHLSKLTTDILTHLRNELNLTQRELAEMLCVSPAYVSQLENGRGRLGTGALARFIELLEGEND